MALEGLRELKKRETRRRISDIATGMFLERGFEAVTVTEVAAAAGVSEKTVYNYFPTKESLVLDQTEGQIERLVSAVRDRDKGVTPTAALVGALKEDSRRFYEMVADDVPRLEEFSGMVRGTPALRAAWSEHRRQMVAALAAVLAEELQVEATDPEPLVAARALTGLVELLYDSRLRHAGAGGRPDEVLERVERRHRARGAAARHGHVVAAPDRGGPAHEGADPGGGGRCRAGAPAGPGRAARGQAVVEGGPPAGA